MSDMQITISVETEESPDPQRHSGVDVSEAQTFLNGVTGTCTSVQVACSCLTVDGEARSLNRSAAGDDLGNALLDDASGWLTENAANE